MADDRTSKQIADDLYAGGMRCNCDLDNWQPERSTGHSWVCRIHKQAIAEWAANELKNYGKIRRPDAP